MMSALISQSEKQRERSPIDRRGDLTSVWYLDYPATASLYPWQWIHFHTRPVRVWWALGSLIGSPFRQVDDRCYVNADLHTWLRQRPKFNSIATSPPVRHLFRELGEMPLANHDYGLLIEHRLIRFYWLDTRCLNAEGHAEWALAGNETRSRIRASVEHAMATLIDAGSDS